MAISFNITEKIMDAMIGYLGENTDLIAASIPIVRWMDASVTPSYPSIMVASTPYDNPSFGKNILLAEGILMNIGVFTEVTDDLTGSVVEQVMGYVRNSLVMDDIEAQLEAEDAQLIVYTNGVEIVNNPAGQDDDTIRQRNINLKITCSIKDDGL